MFGFAFGNGGAGAGGGAGNFPFFGGMPLAAGQNALSRNFQKSYRAFSFAMHPSGNTVEHEKGDKVFLPASALEELMRRQIDYPMLFQLQNTQLQRVTHCGVLEFSAEEGRIYMPHWMMENLLLTEGTVVTITNVSLPKANYTKLQPQENEFLKVSNPKAVLEHALRKFSCLTKGNQITIIYNNNKFNIMVKDLKPADACSIIETDCQVDFEEPPNWRQEQAKWKEQAAAAAVAAATAGGNGGAGGAAAATAGSGSASSSSSSSSSSSAAGHATEGARAGGAGRTLGGGKGSPGTSEKVGILDLKKLAAERAERRRQLMSPEVKPFSGSGRRVDGRQPKKKKKASASNSSSSSAGTRDGAPPPAPQAPVVAMPAPAPGASTNRAKQLQRFRKRKESHTAFNGTGNSLSG